MTVDLNKLQSMPKAELIEIAKQVNAPFNNNFKEPELVNTIINTVMQRAVEAKKETVAPEEKEPVFLTEKEVEKAIAEIKERNKAFSTVYSTEDRCVTFKYNDGRYKHAETLNLSTPLKKLVRKANELSKGPLRLRTHQKQEWDSYAARSPGSQYTESVLA